MFVVAKPDVFKSPDSDTYIIFGEAKVEDFGAQQQAQAAQNFAPPSQSAAQAALQTAKPSAAAITEVAADSMEEVDSTGIAENDIDLVMNQAGVTRAKAVAALRKQDSDIVSAIMELTMA
jgi:nascent polypeptide-associated complex subunit alpha